MSEFPDVAGHGSGPLSAMRGWMARREYAGRSIEGLFLAGDEASHGQVVRWIAQVLTRPRFRMVRDEHGDLLQEILKRVVESLRAGRFDPTLDFRIYVQSIARYTTRDAVVRRLRSRGVEVPGDLDPADGSDVEQEALTRRLASQVMHSVPDGCRRLFRMFFYEQLDQAEIARALCLPLGTVKSRLFRCLQETRQRCFEPAGRTGNKK